MSKRKSLNSSKTSFYNEGETVAVVITQKGKEHLNYLVPKGGVILGAIVQVPLRNKIVLGIVWCSVPSSKNSYEMRKISKVLDLPKLNNAIRNFLKKSSEYNIFSLSTALRLCLNPSLNIEKYENEFFYEMGIQKLRRFTPERKRVLAILATNEKKPIGRAELIARSFVSDSVIRNLEEKKVITKVSIAQNNDFVKIQPSFSKTLSNHQKEISHELCAKVKTQSYSTIMLKGVTGSGKTEVYMDAIAEAISLGRQVLVLFPEISLGTTFYKHLKKRFKFGFAEWHSSISKKEKRKILKCVLKGSLKLVFGARSAVFLPFSNLGLIIVDEEHDTSYKQEEGVRYHGRDMAVLKGFYSDAPVILVSATPSLETWVNVAEMKYASYTLPERFGNASLPQVRLIDMRGNSLEKNHWISEDVTEKIEHCIKKNQQSLLFLNRRGYTPLLMCESCFHILSCESCDAKLTEHKLYKAILCHLCGVRYDFPKTCPSCHNNTRYISIGPGIEKIEEEAKSLFPNARIEMLSSDHYKNSKDLREGFERINSGEIDIIIGTKIISKGHNFPFLSFVGVIDVDLALQGGDIRAAENTFQLLRQVIGRAGRFNTTGEAFIQTYFPEDLVMKTICSENDEEFMNLQSKLRKTAKVPPFGRMIALIFTGSVHEITMYFARKITIEIYSLKQHGVEIFGPADARISKLRKKYRIRVLLKSSKKLPIQTLLRNILEKIKLPRGVNLTIDVDPLNFY